MRRRRTKGTGSFELAIRSRNEGPRAGLYGLALSSGIGGIELGLGLVAPAYRTVCYVEREIFSAGVMARRMEEGHLDAAPVYPDLQSFDARPWRGVVDIITSGFPCQPFSVAGKKEYESDERHLWPEIARIVEECGAPFVFLENVNVRAFAEPWRDLRSMGFNLSRPYACTAAELGAGHLRRRVFVLAYRPGVRLEGYGNARAEEEPETVADADCDSIRDSEQRKPGRPSFRIRDEGKEEPGQTAVDSDFERGRPGQRARQAAEAEREADRDTDGRGREVLREPQHERQSAPGPEPDRSNVASGLIDGGEESEGFWDREPKLERLVDGVPNRMDRDRAIGNAVVPVMAARAFEALAREEGLIVEGEVI